MSIHHCFHCNQETSDDIKVSHKIFCCQGCKTVYEILHENDLEKFYELNHSPGIIPNEKNTYQFDFLDTKSIREKLVDFDDDQSTSVRFFIPSIHCSSCVWLLENLPKIQPFILCSTVDFSARTLSVIFKNREYKLSELAHFLNKIGYKPALNLESLENKKPSGDSYLFYKITIAFFCFANSMLLAFPEYLGSHGDLWLKDNQYFFRMLMLLLSLPVMFYSATDFFRSAYTAVLQKNLHIDVPIALGMLVLFLRSFYEVLTGFGPGYFDSFSGLVFFMLLGRAFQIRTYRFLAFDRDYKSFYPIAVTRIHNQKEENILLSDLHKGDRILIRNEEIIPADVILISDEAFIDNSFITGESRLVSHKSGDRIYAGGRQRGGVLEVEVIKEVEQSRLIQLWSHQAFEKSKVYLDSLVNRWSYYFTLIVLISAVFTAIYWYYFDQARLFQAVCAVLIVACPCALALSTPFTLGHLMRIFSREGLYVRDIHTIERMTKVNTLVFDKTGTLTESEGTQVNYKGSPLNKNQHSSLAALFRNSKHPLSRSLCNYLKNSSVKEVSDFQEFPGRGLQACINGSFIKAGSADYIGAIQKRAQNRTQVFVSIEGRTLGCFIFHHRYRRGLKNLFKHLSRYRLSVLSGDNNAERPFLKSLFPLNSEMLFWKNPQQKLDYINQLQQNGYGVMMFGDGLNDAGALKQSDVGVAISESVNNFSPDCDVLMQADKFHRIPYFLNLSRMGIQLVMVAFLISLFYNAIGLTFAISGHLKPVIAALLMPASSLSVMLFATSSTWIVSHLLRGK
ncbi:heavy metal translocating P-type ATPase [Bacteroidetes bacterium endosymbiont of Geopemphigus sp.]|uniref:heavy metal translocating P-type ATPase n=1 Tax=Bacteroidetes bacterium endosymbiont of Geopemphigus sp. TaxID=2047937 RepID=UPI000CD288CB|nr:heavy metal translocating P-type ATPase metal-binding domain-containing protein [Bacteroidetes bacterium endosymbiont of Geopemphigus sp.]